MLLGIVRDIILDLGFVPSTQSMVDLLKQRGKRISKSSIVNIYYELEKDGVIKDSGVSPRWVIAACPHCNHFFHNI